MDKAQERYPDMQEILASLRRLEGVVFAGQSIQTDLVSSCTCQNCSCNSRAGDNCGCVPVCTCQGRTDRTPVDMLDHTLGISSVLPLDDIKTLVEIRKRAVELTKKELK